MKKQKNVTDTAKKSAIYLPKPFDFIIFALPVLIAAFVFCFFATWQTNQGEGIKSTAKIIVDGKIVRQIELDNNLDESLDLKLRYNNIIEVKSGKIGIKSADCGDKTCVKTGYISTPGQIIACVPSGLIIKIDGGSDNADAVTR